MRPGTRFFKWFRVGRTDPDSGAVWPEPDGADGWVVSGPRLRVHACGAAGLPYEIGEELWEVEVRGQVHTKPFPDQAPFAGTGVFPTAALRHVVTRARLVRRVDAWGSDAAVALAEMCAIRTRERVLSAVADAQRAVQGHHPEGMEPGGLGALAIDHAERLLAMWRTVAILDPTAFATLAGAHASVAASSRAATALMYFRAAGETDLGRGRLVAGRAMADERLGQVQWLLSELGLSDPAGLERPAVA